MKTNFIASVCTSYERKHNSLCSKKISQVDSAIRHSESVTSIVNCIKMCLTVRTTVIEKAQVFCAEKQAQVANWLKILNQNNKPLTVGCGRKR